MARAATNTDVFNAIGEPKRREIISMLRDGKDRTVGDMSAELGMNQPAVSKHLGVLRKLGVVSVTKNGRLRIYRLNAKKLKPIHDWVTEYEQFWTVQLDRIKVLAEKMANEE